MADYHFDRDVKELLKTKTLEIDGEKWLIDQLNMLKEEDTNWLLPMI